MAANLAIGGVTGPGVNVFLVLHTTAAPTWIEWHTYLDQIREYGEANGWNVEGMGTVVVTDGGAPTTEQRTAASDLLAHAEAKASATPRIAVVTDSLPLRAMMRALLVFNPQMRVFAPTDFPGAINFAGLARDRTREVLDAMQGLERSKLGEGRVKTLAMVAAALGR